MSNQRHRAFFCAAAPLILPEHADRMALVRYFGDAFSRLHVDLTSNLTTNSSIMIAHGLGCTLVIEGSLPFLDRSDRCPICWRPLSPELTAPSCGAWKRQQPYSRAAEKLIEHIRRSLREMETAPLQ